jgi:hypothetical protein
MRYEERAEEHERLMALLFELRRELDGLEATTTGFRDYQRLATLRARIAELERTAARLRVERDR